MAASPSPVSIFRVPNLRHASSPPSHAGKGLGSKTLKTAKGVAVLESYTINHTFGQSFGQTILKNLPLDAAVFSRSGEVKLSAY